MLSSLVGALLFAIAHHIFNQNLDHTPVRATAFTQHVNTAVGTAFAFIVRALMVNCSWIGILPSAVASATRAEIISVHSGLPHSTSYLGMGPFQSAPNVTAPCFDYSGMLRMDHSLLHNCATSDVVNIFHYQH